MSIIPWLIGGGVGLFALAKKKNASSSTEVGTGGVFQIIIDFPNGITQGQADIARSQWQNELVGGEVLNVQRIGSDQKATLQIDARYDSYPNIAPVQSTFNFGGAQGKLVSVQRIG